MENSGQRRPLSLAKRLLFTAFVFSLFLIVLEGLAYWKIGGKRQFAWLQTRQTQIATGTSEASEVIHPYLGWVLNRDVHPGIQHGRRHIPVNRAGFADTSELVQHRAADRLIVGVLGGSVAWQMSVDGEQTLRKVLENSSHLQGKQIVLVRLALSGFKQPQQLLSLSYALLQGAEFDVIVNVDGYNEIALPTHDNTPNGVSYLYPRAWHARTMELSDARIGAVGFRAMEIKSIRQEWAQWFSKMPFKNSRGLALIWKWRDASMLSQSQRFTEIILTHKRTSGRGFQVSGPFVPYTDTEREFQDLVQLWQRGSMNIHALCQANQIAYVHVLQPNQYVPGSKPMGRLERRETVVIDQEEGQGVARGFPMLIEAGRALRENGVAFYDMTGLFAQTEERIYIDPWCHFNALGNRMLAKAVAQAILEQWPPSTAARAAVD